MNQPRRHVNARMRIIEAELPAPPSIANVVRHASAQPSAVVQALTHEIVSDSATLEQ